MDQTVQAVVLRRRDSGESDRRLTLLTPELGKVDVVAKGARKGASRLAGVSEPLSAAVLTLAAGKRNRFVTQAQPISSFRGLRTDYDRLQYGLALCELFAAVLPAEQPDPDAYALLLRSLAYLEVHPKPLVALVWSQAHLLNGSGFLPELTACVVTGEPATGPEILLSPQAGGVVSDDAARRFADRFPARREVLVNVLRLLEVAEPPGNLRYAPETLLALHPFWRAIAGAAIPANEGLVNEIRHAPTEPRSAPG